MKWFSFFVLLVFFSIGVYGCNGTEEITEEVFEEELVEEEQEITLLEEDFTFKIGTLPYRGAVLFIFYEGEEDFSEYSFLVDISSNGEIKQEKMIAEEVDGNLAVTIIDLMYLLGDELNFAIEIQNDSGEKVDIYYSEVLKQRYPWKDWMIDLSEPVSLITPFQYDWPNAHNYLGSHSSWDFTTTPHKAVKVYSGTVGVIISPGDKEDVKIYNPYVGAILLYGHVSPTENLCANYNVVPGEHIGNVIPKNSHIHYNVIRPLGYRKSAIVEYWPVVVINRRFIYSDVDYYKDPFYFHEPTTLGYWNEETLPKGFKEEMLTIFQRRNPGVILPATEPLKSLD